MADTNQTYIVTVTTSEKFYLRGTVWTSEISRADIFADSMTAQASAKKAEKFMAPKIKKTYQITPNT